MNDAKVTYKSAGVVIAQGPNAARKASEHSGHTPEFTEQMSDFAKEILELAQERGLSVEQCYTACLNAMCLIIETCSKDEEGKAKLVGLTTEAFCAFVGGGSDNGVRS